MRPKNPDGDAERRERFTERLRGWAERWGLHMEPQGYPARLARLEAGEPVVVRGWELVEGLPSDEDYVLEPDRALVPVEAIYVDPSAPVLTELNYRRPDGTLVRP